MRPHLVYRKTHYWIAAVLAIPVLVIVSTGFLLQLKKQWTWVQPAEQRGTGTQPGIDLEGILRAVKTVPAMGVQGWDDVNRLDVRPSRGMVKVWLRNGWEVQVDLGTGRVLQTAYRRSDLIESIHDGSYFAGDVSKLGVFLPVGLGLLAMWVTGIYMFFLPIVRRRGERRRRARQALEETR